MSTPAAASYDAEDEAEADAEDEAEVAEAEAAASSSSVALVELDAEESDSSELDAKYSTHSETNSGPSIAGIKFQASDILVFGFTLLLFTLLVCD